MSDVKKYIALDIFADCMSNFLYYDRKGCETFQVGEIEKLIEDGVVTVEDFVEVLRKNLG